MIANLYRRYSKPPRSVGDWDIDGFVSICGELYGVSLDDLSITFGNLDKEMPFRTILLRHIYGIVTFKTHVALVTPSYILFFNREVCDVWVHMKPESHTLLKRIYYWVRYHLLGMRK